MLLADGGNEVTILERDMAPPPDPADAWTGWERRGVNQFRLPHFFLSRFRGIVESELPRLTDALAAAGCCRYNMVENIPDEMKGGSRPDDDRFDLVTGRRSVVESVAARVTEETSGVTVRRGSAVRGLVTGTGTREGVPNVVGVELQNGELLGADLVVDASGRRSALPRWIAACGGPPVPEELDDSGFVYYGRHFRSPDGSLPMMIGPLKQDYGSISALTLPADKGTWSVTVIARARDAAMRALSDPGKWQTLIMTLPQAAHWIDAEPIDDGVAVMAKIEDRIRQYAPNGAPLVTGVVALGDSWSCTNPSLGRGASIGLMHAVVLRDTLRDTSETDPWNLTSTWYELTRSEIEPWYRSTLNYDRHRLDEVHAIIGGEGFTTEDPEWIATRALETHGGEDPELLRTFLELGLLLQRADLVALDPTVRALIEAHGSTDDGAPPLGPSRTELVAAIA
jgi:2-polyprenyl-6-methoxyphenol hydroxylase-like FAD-dependent oxidoreductase